MIIKYLGRKYFIVPMQADMLEYLKNVKKMRLDILLRNENNVRQEFQNFLFYQDSKKKKIDKGDLKKNINKQQLTLLQSQYLILKNNFQSLMNKSNSKKIKTNPCTIVIANICPLPKHYKSLKNQVYLHIKQKQTNKSLNDIFNQLYQNQIQYSRVTLFLMRIFQKILPKGLYGQQNTQIFLQSTKTLLEIKLFVQFKRFQNYKIQDIIYDMDIFKLPWRRTKYSKKWKYYIKQKYRHILANITIFIYNNILIPIVRYNFYVTQKHKESNKIFYFRKQIWDLIAKLSIKKFSEQNLQRIDKNLLKQLKGKFPEGKLRIMPKKNSFRPIITFNKKIKNQYNQFRNLNQILLYSRLILRNLKKSLPQIGFCIFDNQQIFQKYHKFVQKWIKKNRPRLYVFSLDIKKCYDSIRTKKLKQIIRTSSLIEENYVINRYIYLYRNKKPLQKMKSLTYYFNASQRFSALSFNHPNFQQGFSQKQSDRDGIIVHLGKTRIVSKSQIIQKLQYVVSGTCLVQFKGQKYIQKCGIPQGLNVSGVLCSLYFAQLQKEYLSFIKQNNNILCLLMRLTDDYIFFSQSQNFANKVLKIMKQCAYQNEFSFNQDKILCNFSSLQINHTMIQQMKEIIWVGKKIIIDTLQIMPYHDPDLKKLKYAMNVNIPNKKGVKRYLKNKLKRFLQIISLLMNHFASGFNSQLYSLQSLLQNVRCLTIISLNKFFLFILQVQKYHVDSFVIMKGIIFIIDVFNVIFHEFVIYVCYLWINQNEVNKYLYFRFKKILILTSIEFFHKYMSKIVFRKLYKYLKLKLKELQQNLKNLQIK